MERGFSTSRQVETVGREGPSPPPRPAAGEPPRVPFNVVDELIHHLDVPAEPWTVQIEMRVDGRLDEERLRAAIAAALARHPMARARRAPSLPWHTQLVWEIRAEAERDVLAVLDCPDDDALATARTRFYSQRVSLVLAPPLRVQLVRHPAGDLLMLSVSHAASDGLGSFRVLVSIVRAYVGAPDVVPDVDPLGVRDVRALLGADGLPARVRRLLAFLAGVRKVRARIAPEGHTDRPGFGFHTVRLPPGETAALVGARAAGATVNDLLLAALHLAIARWNGEHGAPCGRIAIMTPVNLRPRERWHEIVGNFSSFVTVSTRPEDRTTPAGAVAAVAARTRRFKRSGAAAALIEILATQPWHPLLVKRTLWPLLSYTGTRVLDTAVLSNLGVLGDLPAFGADGGRVTELWFSPPARMPLGLAVGAATLGGRLHLTFRYRHLLFGPEAAARFADRYVEALHSLG
jgi:NRPS condensation-like uncharacterized protein